MFSDRTPLSDEELEKITKVLDKFERETC